MYYFRACGVSTETDSESILTPSSTCTDLLENLHDLKLYTVAQSTFDTDPNANCQPAKHYADMISEKLYQHTDNIVNSMSYSRQESATTITDEIQPQHLDPDQCAQLEWDEDELSSASTQGVGDSHHVPLSNGLLLPAT